MDHTLRIAVYITHLSLTFHLRYFYKFSFWNFCTITEKCVVLLLFCLECLTNSVWFVAFKSLNQQLSTIIEIFEFKLFSYCLILFVLPVLFFFFPSFLAFFCFCWGFKLFYFSFIFSVLYYFTILLAYHRCYIIPSFFAKPKFIYHPPLYSKAILGS